MRFAQIVFQERIFRLNRIMGGMGVSFLDVFSLVQFTEHEEIPTACWSFNSSTEKEVILFNAIFFDSLDDQEVMLVLKHEILHKGFYNGVNFNFSENMLLGNIALDVCINFILFKENGEGMKKLSEKIFADCNYDSPIVLCNCIADINRIKNEMLNSMYSFIWNNLFVPSPYYLYYNLLELYGQNKLELPFPYSGENIEIRINGSTFTVRMDPVTKRDKSIFKRLFKKVINSLNKNDPGLNELMDRFTLEPKKTGAVDQIKEFLGNIIVKKLSKITEKIKNDLSEKTSRDIYPWNLTRLGTIYLLMGVYSTLPYYHNKMRSITDGRKKQISIYIDCSGSMYEILPKISWVLREIDEFPVVTFNSSTLYSFDTGIAEVDIDDIQKGEFSGGGGTDFDEVIHHFLFDKLDNEAILIFTDGGSYLDLQTILEFKMSGKRLYVIYFGEGVVKSDLDEIAEMTITVN